MNLFEPRVKSKTFARNRKQENRASCLTLFTLCSLKAYVIAKQPQEAHIENSHWSCWLGSKVL